MSKKPKRGSRRAALLRLFRRTRNPEPLDLNYTDWNGLDTLINVLNGNIRAFGSLRSAVVRLSGCVGMFENQARTHQEYAKLGTDINDLLHIVAQRFGGAAARSITRDSIARLARGINEETGLLLKKNEESDGGTIQVLKHYRRVLACLALFSVIENMTIWKADDYQGTRLELLSHSPEARYRAAGSTGIRRTGCIPDTRVDVLQELRDWVYYGKFQNIFWLNGPVGTGKTAIAYSLCEYLETLGKPAANFFCSRHVPACRDVNRIIPSISYQLAQLSRPFRCAVSSALQQDPEVHKQPIRQQFEELIAAPLRSVGHTFSTNVVLVIDALEECDDQEGAHHMLESWFEYSSDLPVRLLISSRPNPGILYHMRGGQGRHKRLELRLHEIYRPVEQGDIRTYLTAKLGHLDLSDADLESLVQRSGRLFAYAASAVSYISQGDSSRGSARFEQLNNASNSEIASKQDVDTRYDAMIEEAFDNSVLDDPKNAEIMLVLRTMACIREPLTVNAMAGLLRLDFSRLVYTTLRSLLPVLHVSDSSGLEITLNESFVKYLVDGQNTSRIYGDACQNNTLLARSCLERIKTVSPLFNICNLNSSYLLDQEVPDLDEKMSEAIPQELLYASRHWGAHLRLAARYDNLATPLCDFLSKRLLLWMEIMNLKHYMFEGIGVLQGVHTWLQETKCPASILKFVHDAWMFAAAFSSNAISDSTPHIYISALQFWPKRRPISLCYAPRLQGPIKASGGRLERREQALVNAFKMDNPVVSAMHLPQGSYAVAVASGNTIYVLNVRTGNKPWALQGHTALVTSVACSPDGAYIVSGSRDNTIRIWGAHTGQLIGQPLQGHTGWVNSVAYSPNGAYFVSGSRDKTIRIWDAHTGQPAGQPLEGHTDWITSIAYSPDGAYILSGSRDWTIRTWDAHTGQPVSQPLQGHTGSVNSIAYSPDGAYVVSGSYDETIRIWDAHTGQPVGQPLRGHTGWVDSIAYSPDGANIVSGSSDKTIRIWDAHASQPVGRPLKGHTRSINLVTYSPDGAYILSGSNDNTIHIWDTYTDQLEDQLLEGHTHQINSLVYSPDGAYIASGTSDNTIRIWDAQTGQPIGQPLQGHTRSVRSVAFSPDGACIVSGSEDETIRIWDARIGQPLGQPLKGHTHWVKSVTYSPNGAYILSGSEDKTICIWDVRTGQLLGQPLKGHTDCVNSVAYSPDSALILSGSDDQTIRIWDAHTGQPIGQPLQGHIDCVKSVAYSPDGAYVLSGSEDETIRIWDTHTGKPVGQPLQGHTRLVNTVAYSPDGAYILSGSDDNTIRTWDARTGQPVGQPFRGHVDWVTSVAFSPDGAYIASGSRDLSIRTWHAPAQPEAQLAPRQADRSTKIYSRNLSRILSFLTHRAPTPNTMAGHTAGDSRKPSEHLSATTTPPPDDLTLDEQGWVVSNNQIRLIWVPYDIRRFLVCPPTATIISRDGFVRLDFLGANVGTEWQGCFDSSEPSYQLVQ